MREKHPEPGNVRPRSHSVNGAQRISPEIVVPTHAAARGSIDSWHSQTDIAACPVMSLHTGLRCRVMSTIIKFSKILMLVDGDLFVGKKCIGKLSPQLLEAIAAAPTRTLPLSMVHEGARRRKLYQAAELRSLRESLHCAARRAPSSTPPPPLQGVYTGESCPTPPPHTTDEATPGEWQPWGSHSRSPGGATNTHLRRPDRPRILQTT